MGIKDLSWSYRMDGKAEWLLDMNILLHWKNLKPGHLFLLDRIWKIYGTLKQKFLNNISTCSAFCFECAWPI